jgi:hypothetical protein
MFAKHSEEEHESENKSKESNKKSYKIQEPAAFLLQRIALTLESPCNPSRSHDVLYGVVPPQAVPVSPNLQEDNYNQQQQQPG